MSVSFIAQAQDGFATKREPCLCAQMSEHFGAFVRGERTDWEDGPEAPKRRSAMRKFSEKDYKETRYGFDWGAAKIERVASHGGHLWIDVRTPRQVLEIRVTPTGLIRIVGHGSRDKMRPEPKSLDE